MPSKYPVKPRRLFYVFFLILVFFPSFKSAAQSPRSGASRGPAQGSWPLLIGTEKGLYGLDSRGKSSLLWSGGSVKKIIRAAGSWIILGSEGIFKSENLLSWENLNEGLPVKTIKIFGENKKSFVPMIQEIKDLELCPSDPALMVCATKDKVFLSVNGAWRSLGAPPYRTNGIKAVAAAYMPRADGGEDLTVFLSHSTYGVFYINPGIKDSRWKELSEGLEKIETTGNADEVSDIAVTMDAGGWGSGGAASDQGKPGPALFASQTFKRRIYRLNWEEKRFDLIWTDGSSFGTVDSLAPGKTGLRFIREDEAAEISYPRRAGGRQNAVTGFRKRQDLADLIRGIPRNLDIEPNCVLIQENIKGGTEWISLSELWLLNGAVQRPDEKGREGIYLPVNHVMDPDRFESLLEVLKSRKLDMIVIDMKDDYGRLRFTPKNDEIAKQGRVFRPLDIDAFLQDMKSRGIYTVARIVVFKDPVLASRNGGKYAVWDGVNNKPWEGYHNADDIKGSLYDEKWVDPYSEEVWNYIAATAEELRERGFNEIQFDYIRFPTDGLNLADARYRWRDTGMDMESAIISFLRHIRSRVKAPISVDIYGANGWYRTGARTGQEVELMAPWVDVICPMYYPSHFEQDFLAQDPAEMRPYRIYYQGTLRTARIGRGRITVRPYAQAFYLNVSYDRLYYNPNYVKLQKDGVRDAGKGGLTYWNNSGRYDDVPQAQ
jgi:hypothetical protein